MELCRVGVKEMVQREVSAIVLSRNNCVDALQHGATMIRGVGVGPPRQHPNPGEHSMRSLPRELNEGFLFVHLPAGRFGAWQASEPGQPSATPGI